MRWRLLFILLTSLAPLAVACAQSDTLREVEFSYLKNNREVVTTVFCRGNTPGKARATRRNAIRFTPLSKQIRLTRNKIKNKPQAKKLKKTLKNLKLLNRAARTACAQQGSGAAYFDNFTGDLTENGRVVLGIPEGLLGNVLVGQQIWSQNCIGCHEERRKLTFDELRTAISRPPMGYTPELLSDANLAQIMTYVSRFRSPQTD